jgi:glucose dehydrogenase
LWGGVLTTAGGLVFLRYAEGFLKGVDAKTGKELMVLQRRYRHCCTAGQLGAGMASR